MGKGIEWVLWSKNGNVIAIENVEMQFKTLQYFKGKVTKGRVFIASNGQYLIVLLQQMVKKQQIKTGWTRTETWRLLKASYSTFYDILLMSLA